MQGYTDKYTPMVGEGHISIFPWHYSAITQGTWVWSVDASEAYYGYFINSSSNQNDRIDYNVYLDVGTYTCAFLTIVYTDEAIITLLIDGGSVGTVDCYGDLAYNQLKSVTGIVITTAGLKTLSVKAASKHASSSDYIIRLDSISLYRTA